MKFTARLNAATKTRVIIKPTESVLDIERCLYETKFCIVLPYFHYIVAAIFDPGIVGHHSLFVHAD
jgi:hypothetical protein